MFLISLNPGQVSPTTDGSLSIFEVDVFRESLFDVVSGSRLDDWVRDGLARSSERGEKQQQKNSINCCFITISIQAQETHRIRRMDYNKNELVGE